ncbi:MAG: hypothetical protein P4L22_07335 [Candidatus Babeliales bacterium]|nr:hypothetical protein [Candidatus Babeliales bacterium]
MLKKLLLISLFVSSSLFSADWQEKGKELLSNDKVQSVVFGALTEVTAKHAIRYFADKGEYARAAALTSMIFLANGINVFRNGNGRMARLLATMFGALSVAFVKNDASWLKAEIR